MFFCKYVPIGYWQQKNYCVPWRSKTSSRSYWRVNNPTLSEFCFWMVRRANIEGSKSYILIGHWGYLNRPPPISCGTPGWCRCYYPHTRYMKLKILGQAFFFWVHILFRVFIPLLLRKPDILDFSLIFSFKKFKLSQWTTMTKESSFVAVIYCDEGKWTAATIENSK